MIHKNEKRTVKIKMNFIIEKDFNIFIDILFLQNQVLKYRIVNLFPSIQRACIYICSTGCGFFLPIFLLWLLCQCVCHSWLYVCFLMFFIYMYVCDAHACPQWDLFPWVIIKCVFQITQEPAKSVTNSSSAFHFFIL